MDITYQNFLQGLARGESGVVATIIQNNGSAPRGAGAYMICRPDGRFSGTVGGGAVEHRAQEMCLQAMKEKRSFLHHFNLSAADEAELGMVCGGNVLIYFQFFDASTPIQGFAAELLRRADGDEHLWLVTQIRENGWDSWAFSETGEFWGITPAQAVQKHFESFKKYYPVLLNTDDTQYFSIPLNASGMVYVFGGGHVAQKLVPELRRVFFDCTVIDDREEFANAEIFPSANRILVSHFEDAFQNTHIKSQDYIVIMTRGHLCDYEVLTRALKTPAKYIGMIGSRSKISVTLTRLIAEDGFTYNDIKRIYAPIGLPIGGETPEEIAVGVAAQMIGIRSGRL